MGENGKTFQEIQFGNRGWRVNNFGLGEIENMIQIPRMIGNNRFRCLFFRNMPAEFLGAEFESSSRSDQCSQVHIDKECGKHPNDSIQEQDP